MGHPNTSILLIEDDEADYQLIKRCLTKALDAYDLCWERSLEAGLQTLMSRHFDVVLVDLSLPDSFGLETVSRIRKVDSGIPVIIHTTLDNADVELKSLEAGVQDYLIKGEITPHAFNRAIYHAIQRQHNIVEIKRLMHELESHQKMLAEQQELLQRKNIRLRRLCRTAQRFVDNVSHEFRTPLTVIKDYVCIVREGMVGEINDEQRHMLDIASVRTDDLNNMVDDMLDVSKIESGLIGAWRHPCRLADIVHSLRLPMEKKAEVKGITLDIHVDENLPEIYCDDEKVSRVIINLMINAMKFCGDPGKVQLWANLNSDQNEVVVGVTDNGQGIDQEGLTEIFKRFKQLKTKTKSSTKGFGLGLNIAKELVELNFGDMNVESQVGQGCTFSFTVPLAKPLEVLRRYLKKIKHLRNGSSVVSLVRATIDPSSEHADADDLDSFFNYLLRKNDLLFRAGTHDWLFVLPTPSSELELFITRSQNEYEKTNRNRPHGPLPQFTFHIEGSWQAGAEADDLLLHFGMAVHREEFTHV